MKNYYLAIDIGASNGRHILGHIENGKIQIEEIHRFGNKIKDDGKNLCWDIPYLFGEIINGIKKCKYLEKIPISIGIDTWAVDYVLLDRNNKLLGKSFSYRDHRTAGTDSILEKIISFRDLYKKTGIQKQMFNTVYQLIATERDYPELFSEAETFLMLPDYFNFLLTGIKKSEYTNATSTQLVNLYEKNWDKDLIRKLGFNENMFLPLNLPGTSVGALKKEIADKVGFNCEVIMPASHDTASAVIATPKTSGKNSVYISSGTWSLIGIETETPICTDESIRLNFSNEGGYNYKFRFLKNIMGLWIIQSVKKETDNLFSFEELCSMAKNRKSF
ncbi:MAG: FGGY family carbohydrate kinase, partial [Leptotrichiaceae bacterium]|nr:FGGY family carbohydrate kinase [Leptotrichiaceae bacterium]